MSNLNGKVIAIAGANDEHLLKLTQEFAGVSFLLYGEGKVLSTPYRGTYIECESSDACAKQAVMSIAKGEATVLMKGIVQTKEILHYVLKEEYDLFDRQRILSHISRIEINNRVLFLSDAAMNIAPTGGQLIAIVENAVEAVLKLGVKHPKVAMLSAAETINPKMQSSVIAHDITEHFKNESAFTVYGPLSLDLALSKTAVEQKRFSGPIAGDADLLIVPFIEVGNVLYKALSLFTPANMSGVILGAKIPIILTSRADAIEAKIASLDFALRLG